MSVMLAPVRVPLDLELPAPEQVHAVMDRLTPEGAVKFVGELMAALEAARTQNDLRPVQEVTEAWYRTLLFVNKYEGEAPLIAVVTQNLDEPIGDAADLKSQLGL